MWPSNTTQGTHSRNGSTELPKIHFIKRKSFNAAPKKENGCMTSHNKKRLTCSGIVSERDIKEFVKLAISQKS